MWAGPTEPGQVVELRFGFSLRGVDQARAEPGGDECGPGPAASIDAGRRPRRPGGRQLGKIRVDTASKDKQTVFSTALYHSLIKPCLAPDECPFWPADGPFAFDICDDVGHLPDPAAAADDAACRSKAVEMANALLYISEEEGNFPIGYRMARGADRFSRQASALAHTFLADLCQLGLPGMDWDWALVHMHTDLRRTYGEDFLAARQGAPDQPHPGPRLRVLVHVADGGARRRPGAGRAVHAARRAVGNAFDAATGLLQDSTYYEGGEWNYSFRLLHDMAGRIELAGGDDASSRMLDQFFGFGAAAGRPSRGSGRARGDGRGVRAQPVRGAEQRAGHGGAVVVPLRRPARPDRGGRARRRAEPFGAGRGGLPGNDDSGGLSLVVRVGVARAVPRRRPEPVPGEHAPWRESSIDVGDGNLTIETTGFVEPTPDGPPQYVQSVTSTVCGSTAPG